MGIGDEVVSPAIVATPLPIEVGKMVLPNAVPTPANVLAWIAATAGRPWFPSQHAAETHSDRDALDDPLNQLRVAGFVRIETWVRGAGQGYVLTPEGEAAAKSGTGIPTLPAKPSEPASANASPPSETELFPTEADDIRFDLDQRPPLIVTILIVMNALWFVVGLVASYRVGPGPLKYLAGDFTTIPLLLQLGGVSGSALLHGEWYRLLTSCFVHGSALHIIMNMVNLALIGSQAELLWGRSRLVVIYLISGLAGSCLAMGLRPDATLVGASGAIWGVLTSMLAWFLLFGPELPPVAAIKTIRRLGLAIILNAAVSFLPGVSWEGHLGGGLAGFVAAGLLNAIRFGDRLRRRLALVLLLLMPVVCIGGLIAAMERSDTWNGARQRVAAEQAHREKVEAEKALREQVAAAQESFNRDVLPLLPQLTPEAVRAVEGLATAQLLRPGDRRNAATVAEVRAKLAEMKAAADAVAALCSSPPMGLAAIDQPRSRWKAAAEARSRSFVLLLAMLDNPAIPDSAAWTAWGTARRAADTQAKGLLRP